MVGTPLVPVDLPHGWLTEAEAAELVWLAQDLVVLEMGAWKGRSTVVLSSSARYVISVDRHEGITGHGQSLDEYLTNVRALKNVSLVIADFEQFVSLLHPVDMIYIDGDHDAESVKRDVGLALGNGAHVLAFHDWDFEEVREPAIKLIGRKPDNLVGSVASYHLK